MTFGTPKIGVWDPQGVPGPQVKNHCIKLIFKLCVISSSSHIHYKINTNAYIASHMSMECNDLLVSNLLVLVKFHILYSSFRNATDHLFQLRNRSGLFGIQKDGGLFSAYHKKYVL